jgi:glyoxylase-like metal-dependent hydrolase (beta-lactamase superfamily II)
MSHLGNKMVNKLGDTHNLEREKIFGGLVLEIEPGVFQLKIPLVGNPLGATNAYVIKTSKGAILIDPGVNTADAFAALTDKLEEIGVALAHIRYIVITHAHPDHYGLVPKLQELVSADLVIHSVDYQGLVNSSVDKESIIAADNWMKINGAPNQNLSVRLKSFDLRLVGVTPVDMPKILVSDNESIELGDVKLQVIWTPGHAPGHICLYDASRELFISGDHVLGAVTPNISMNLPSAGNPLLDFETSLKKIRAYPVKKVLPGHGEVFTEFEQRIGELLQHHEDRLEELYGILKEGPNTAYTIASKATWFSAWEDFSSLNKHFAVTETLAHLEYLLLQGRLAKELEDGVYWYRTL